MTINTEANSVEALRRKMLIAGTAGLHEGMRESELVDTPHQQAGVDAKALQVHVQDGQDGQDEEKAIQN